MYKVDEFSVVVEPMLPKGVTSINNDINKEIYFKRINFLMYTFIHISLCIKNLNFSYKLQIMKDSS